MLPHTACMLRTKLTIYTTTKPQLSLTTTKIYPLTTCVFSTMSKIHPSEFTLCQILCRPPLHGKFQTRESGSPHERPRKWSNPHCPFISSQVTQGTKIIQSDTVRPELQFFPIDIYQKEQFKKPPSLLVFRFSSSTSFLAALSQTEHDKMQRSSSRQILIRLWGGLCQTHQDLSDLRFLQFTIPI